MNKKMKIITLILSCVLLIGAAVGITASAEQNAPVATVKLEGQNISYEGAVRVAYYLSTANLGEKQSVKLLLSDDKFNEPTNINGELKNLNNGDVYVKDVEDKVEFKDKDGNVTATYDIAYSNGIAPKELRDDIYAMAVVVDENGDVVARSLKKIYSPYKYAMNRFNGTPSDDQYGLYTALLNYGAAVQAVLNHNAEAGKWADEYIVVTRNTITNGTSVPDNFTLRGTQIPDPLSYDYAAEKWQGEDKNLIFTGFTKADGTSYFGEKFAANWNKITLKPGSYTFNEHYTSNANGGAYVSFDSDTGEATNIKGFDNVVSANKPINEVTTEYNNGVDGDSKAIDYKYKKIESVKIMGSKLMISKRLEVTEAGGKYAKGDVPAAYANQTTFSMKNSSTAPNLKAWDYESARHVLEFDINVKKGNLSGAHFAQFYFGADSYNGNGEGTYLWSANLNDKGGKSFYMTVEGHGADGVAADEYKIIANNLAYDVDHTFRFEYYRGVNGEDTMAVDCYVDGQYKATYYNRRGTVSGAVAVAADATSDEKCAFWRFNLPSASRNTVIEIDNVYLGTDYHIYGADDNHGKSRYETLAGGAYDFSDGVDTGTVYVDGSSNAAKVGSNGLTHNADGYLDYKYATGGTPTYMYKAQGDTTGDYYVSSFDFKWNGSDADLQAFGNRGTATGYATAHLLFIGMTNGVTGVATGDYFYRLHATSIIGHKGSDLYLELSDYHQTKLGSEAARDKYYTQDSEGNWIFKDLDALEAECEAGSEIALKQGVWYNIRIEYVPDGNGRYDARYKAKTVTTTQKYNADGTVNGSATTKESSETTYWCKTTDVANTEYAEKQNYSAEKRTNNTDGSYTIVTTTYKMTEAVTSDSAVKGKASYYVNDELIASKNIVASEGTIGGEKFDNSTVGFTSFQGRSASYVNGGAWSIDNVYTGAFSNSDYNYQSDGNTDKEDPTYDAGITGGLTFDTTDGFTTPKVTLNAAPATKSGYVDPTGAWARIIKEGTNNALMLGTRGGENTAYFDAKMNEGYKYVFDTDLKWLGTSKIDPAATSRWVLKIGLESQAVENKTGENTDNYMMSIFGYLNHNDCIDLYLNGGLDAQYRQFLCTIPKAQWTNLHVEFTPVVMDGTSALTGHTTVYVNGIQICEAAETYCRDSNKAVEGFNTTYANAYVNLRGLARDAVVLVDDTCVYTLDRSYTVTEDFQDGEAGIQTNRTNYATIKTDESGNSYLNFAAVTNTTGGEGHAYITVDPIADHAVLGSSYEVSFKLRMNNMEVPEGKKGRNWWMYFGAFTSAEVTSTFANAAVEVSNATGISGTGAETVAKFCDTNLTEGTWYEVKMIFTVTAITDTTISLSTAYSLGDNTKTFKTVTFNADEVIGIGFKTASKGSDSNGYLSELNFDIDDITVTATDTFVITDIDKLAE